MWCVPGQHDLPYHNLAEVRRSSYQTLEFLNKIETICRGGMVVDGMWIQGFPYGSEITPCAEDAEGFLKIAVAHKYVWYAKSRHAMVTKDQHISELEKNLEGYDVAVFGDNHIPFTCLGG